MVATSIIGGRDSDPIALASPVPPVSNSRRQRKAWWAFATKFGPKSQTGREGLRARLCPCWDNIAGDGGGFRPAPDGGAMSLGSERRRGRDEYPRPPPFRDSTTTSLSQCLLWSISRPCEPTEKRRAQKKSEQTLQTAEPETTDPVQAHVFADLLVMAPLSVAENRWLFFRLVSKPCKYKN
jgi:hypothetical protein